MAVSEGVRVCLVLYFYVLITNRKKRENIRSTNKLTVKLSNVEKILNPNFAYAALLANPITYREHERAKTPTAPTFAISESEQIKCDNHNNDYACILLMFCCIYFTICYIIINTFGNTLHYLKVVAHLLFIHLNLNNSYFA